MNITEPSLIKKVIEALANEHALEVLQAASRHEVSVPELVSEHQIPKSSAYYVVSELEKSGLLEKVGGDFGPDGRRFDVWRTLIAKISLTVESNCTLELLPRSDITSRFLRLWKILEGGENG